MSTDQFGPTPTMAEIKELFNQINKLLQGRGARMQAIVLAEIVAMYFAGHNPAIREQALALWIDTMKGLIEPNEERIMKAYGLTSWDDKISRN